MQVIWTSLKTDNQITMPTPHHCFLWAGCSSCYTTNSIKALKATQSLTVINWSCSKMDQFFISRVLQSLWLPAIWLRHHLLRGVDSVRLQILSVGTCRQCGAWSVAGHNRKKVIGRGPICANLHDMDLDPSGNGSTETMYDEGDQNLAVGAWD